MADQTDWIVRFDGFDPEQERLRETLCTLGNGYFATRGAAEETEADAIHYPGTYLAGGYNRRKTEIAGRTVENEDFVNLPNWIGLTFRPEDGEWFHPNAYEILTWTREIDLRHGILTRTLHVRDPQGRETRLCYRRFVSLADPHLAGISLTLTPENWTGGLHIRSALDGRVRNAGVKRYQQLRSDHLEAFLSQPIGEEGIALLVRTNQSQITIAQAARTQLFRQSAVITPERTTETANGSVVQDIALTVAPGETLTIEKIVALFTSRDRAIAECRLAAKQAIDHAERFTPLVERHTQAWQQVWELCDITIVEQPHIQRVLRLHAFHLLQTVSAHTRDLDVSIPARGLHGEAYRGHIFWDELFVLPFFTFRLPELTRSLLLYRYRRLPQARAAARLAGYQGAMYPWQSGSDGREESQVVHLNPSSGRWIPDHSALQRHVNIAIAYNVWQYYQTTLDTDFLSLYGAEVIVDIARFWASAATYNPELERYEIRGVMGPDEYHESYPGSETPGLNNNAYTNVMAVWTLQRALDVLALLPAERSKVLRSQLELSEQALERWTDITRKMRVVFHGDGMLSQFEGFETLQEFDWDGYRKKYGDIHRLDRILEAENDSPDRYQVAKQADALMLFYLLPMDEVIRLLRQLGYPMDPTTLRTTIDYYFQRTSHGSTLSRVVHAWVLARIDPQRSWQLFLEALESDINDIQGGTTDEGIHAGVMAGTIDLVQRCYMGMETRDDTVWFRPCLPESLSSGLAFRFQYRGNWFSVRATQHTLHVTFDSGWHPPARIGIAGQVSELRPGETQAFALE
ncbi:MAG: hypothetical protein OXC18_21965 [Desulfurellaceae bacterium]|nr:hypothetical protein [Desulfurellaceae bacterium]